MQIKIDVADLMARFLRYVRVDTTSNEESTSIPSTSGQLVLGRMLVDELKALGIANATQDEFGYVYGLLPENLPAKHPRRGKIPAIGWIAHLDTSSAVAGHDIHPIVHENYDGGPIPLPGDKSVVLTPEADAPLGECQGCTIVTSDGTTLLGADDKSGIAIIFATLKALIAQPEILHGPIAIGFTPDEEIGRGADKFNLERFAAEAAYTLDGESLGEIEDETFCADSMTVTFHGVNVHPGHAKGKMINAVKLASRFVANLPIDRLSPETTSGRQGFMHPHEIRGNEEQSQVRLLLRDFTKEGLDVLAQRLHKLAQVVEADHPGSKVTIELKPSYRNMKEVLDRRPEVTAFAGRAVEAAGLRLEKRAIRGGTDGSRLSFMGLPTPNIFAGGHNFHSRREWVAVEHMVKGAEVLVHLSQLWAQEGEKQK